MMRPMRRTTDPTAVIVYPSKIHGIDVWVAPMPRPYYIALISRAQTEGSVWRMRQSRLD